MSKLKSVVCPPRHKALSRANELAPLIIEQIESATSEREWLNFLRDKPEIMGWRFSEGISPATIVRPEFELPGKSRVDFLVIDCPQWTQLNLIEIEDPLKAPFTKDRKYGEKLNDAVRQTTEWKQEILDDKTGFINRLMEAITEIDDFGEYDQLFRGVVIPRILVGNFRILNSIVIGRRHELHVDYRDKRVVSFFDATDKHALFSYDALVDTCIGERYEPNKQKT